MLGRPTARGAAPGAGATVVAMSPVFPPLLVSAFCQCFNVARASAVLYWNLNVVMLYTALAPKKPSMYPVVVQSPLVRTQAPAVLKVPPVTDPLTKPPSEPATPS